MSVGTIEFVIGHEEISPDRLYGKAECPHCSREYATRSGMRQHIEAKHTPRDWRDMKDAPRDGTWIQARVPGYGSDFVVAWVGGLLDSDGNDAASWAVMSEQEPPDDWTDGTCWAINADCVPSTQPDAWKPLPEDV